MSGVTESDDPNARDTEIFVPGGARHADNEEKADEEEEEEEEDDDDDEDDSKVGSESDDDEGDCGGNSLFHQCFWWNPFAFMPLVILARLWFVAVLSFQE